MPDEFASHYALWESDPSPQARALLIHVTRTLAEAKREAKRIPAGQWVTIVHSVDTVDGQQDTYYVRRDNGTFIRIGTF